MTPRSGTLPAIPYTPADPLLASLGLAYRYVEIQSTDINALV